MSGSKVIAHLLENGDESVVICCMTDIFPSLDFIDPIINVKGNKLITRRGMFFAHGLVDENDLHYMDDFGRCWCDSLESAQIHCPFKPKETTQQGGEKVSREGEIGS